MFRPNYGSYNTVNKEILKVNVLFSAGVSTSDYSEIYTLKIHTVFKIPSGPKIVLRAIVFICRV